MTEENLDSLLLKYLGDTRSIDLWKIIAKEWLTQKRQEHRDLVEEAYWIIDELLRELK